MQIDKLEFLRECQDRIQEDISIQIDKDIDDLCDEYASKINYIKDMENESFSIIREALSELVNDIKNVIG